MIQLRIPLIGPMGGRPKIEYGSMPFLAIPRDRGADSAHYYGNVKGSCPTLSDTSHMIVYSCLNNTYQTQDLKCSISLIILIILFLYD
jgi:hypothetical protein